uniref:Uncharacterized protein n=1 Tax=Panagrolaimus sp. ES5 TaxID=591445 RepID=A0AC34GCK6_9BILA
MFIVTQIAPLPRSSQTSSNAEIGASKTKKNPLAQASSLVDRFTSRRQDSLPQMKISSTLNSTPPASKDSNVHNSSISPPKLSTLDEDDDRFDAISQASTGKLVMRKGEQRPWRNFFTRSFISSTDSSKKEDEENEEHYESHRAALQSPRIAHRRRVSVIGDVECDRKIFANKYAAFAPS